MRRIAVGGVIHETHTFSATPTDLDAFRRQSFVAGDELVQRMAGTPTAMGGVLQGLREAGDRVMPLLYAAAMPSGVVTRQAYVSIRDRLLTALAGAMPVDGVVLTLHGAMVAEDEDDCDGDILTGVRHLVGPSCPVVSVLDMHGNVSPAMVAAADVLIGFDTNPHLDTVERGMEAAHILHRMLDAGVRPAAALAHPPLLLSALTTWTAQPPLRPVHQHAQLLRRDERVLNVSVMGGFAYADTPSTGMSIVVTTVDDRDLAQRMADELAAIAWRHRAAATYRGRPIEEAVAAAIAAPRGPVVLADVGDNIGGGTPGDGTTLLQALLAMGARDCVVTLADAEAVGRAYQAGAGALLDLAVGGKSDPWHGNPVRVHGEVERLTDGRYTVSGSDHFAQLYGREVQMGRCAVLRCEGVRLLLTERKTPPGDLAQLRSQGIVPEEQKIIVVKAAVAFRGAYEPIAAAILEVDTPGLCAPDLRRFQYHKVPRPMYPVDEI
jgi:microcystin degradation protein MlrC